MRHRWVFFVAMLLPVFCSGQIKTSEPVANSDTSQLLYPRMFSLVTDTAWQENAVQLLQVQWMDTSFQLVRKYGQHITNAPVPKKDNGTYTLYRQEAAWDGKGFLLPHANCHSFGLAQAFRNAGIQAAPLFNKHIFVGPEALEVLLATSFKRQSSRDATSMKSLRLPVPAGSLLVFRDSNGTAIHTAFQTAEGLLSKNGQFEPRVYHRLFDVKKVYYKAKTIDLYQLTTLQVKAYLGDRPLQASRIP